MKSSQSSMSPVLNLLTLNPKLVEVSYLKNSLCSQLKALTIDGRIFFFWPIDEKFKEAKSYYRMSSTT